MAEHNILGNKGENIAVRYLAGEGLVVLECNWRSGRKEIDIIAKEQDVLVFIEVKSRRNENYGDARDAVTPRKMRNIISAADAYIKKHKIDNAVRFDIVTIVGNGDSHKIEHIRDAFYPGIE